MMQLLTKETEPYFKPEHLQRIKDYRDGKLSTVSLANGDYWYDGYTAGNANTDWYDTIYRDHTFRRSIT